MFSILNAVSETPEGVNASEQIAAADIAEKALQTAEKTVAAEGAVTASSNKAMSLLDPAKDFVNTFGTWLSDQKEELFYFFIGVVVSFVIAYAVSWGIRHVLLKLTLKTKTELDDKIVNGLHAPIISLIVVTGAAGSITMIKLNETIAHFVHKLYYAAATLIIVWALLRIVSCLNEYFKTMADRTHNTFDNLLIDLLRRVIKVSVWIIAILFIAQNIFELNVSALLAGAGVAGLAIAFAAQNTIANIFGAITLILDKPFAVGDRVVASGHDGIIESVGLRSTKLRGIDGTQWCIPNKEMSEVSIQNITRRPNFKHIFDIGVVYSTTPEQIRRGIEILHELLDNHPMFDYAKKPPRINFANMKDWSLNIQAIVWFQTPDYFEYLNEVEKINFEVLTRFNAEGLEFALPSNTTYLAGDTQRPVLIDAERKES